MGKQVFNIVGMSRDLDPAKAKDNHAYEIRNLRLTAQEDSTLLALTTEKGNSQYELTNPIEGKIVGYCVVGTRYLVIFSHALNYDYIYRLEEAEKDLINTEIYKGKLGFTNETKIETLGIYENEDIQRVYWIDGIHQPRVINIVASQDIIDSWKNSKDPFDFLPALSLQEKVAIYKSEFAGIFNPGTIQYAFSYLKENGQQSNLFYISPIHYIAQDNRGASPEETVSTSFEINLNNLDKTFDYVNIYSIQRTSENGTPICRRVAKLSLNTAEAAKETIFDIRTSAMTIPETKKPVLFFGSLGLNPTRSAGGDKYFDIENYLVKAEGNTWDYEVTMDKFPDIEPQIPSINPYQVFVKQGNTFKKYTYEGEGSIIVKVQKTLTEEGYTYTIINESDLQANTTPYYIYEKEIDNPLHKSITFIDSGILGEAIDYSEILYLNNGAIIPKTMAAKNNKLFFGNYEYITTPLDVEGLGEALKTSKVTYGYADKAIPKGNINSNYMYDNSLDLSQADITTFKGGETYTFGIILQDGNGVWSSVIPLKSKYNSLYPKDFDTSFYPVKAFLQLDSSKISKEYKNLKIVRRRQLNTVIAQGALCPTVFRFKERQDESIYSRASWFFRSMNSISDDINTDQMPDETLRTPFNTHNCNIPTNIYTMYRSEIISASAYTNSHITSSSNNSDFFIDQNIITLHSPDCKFTTFPLGDLNVRIVGLLPLTSSRSWLFSQVSNPNGSFQRDDYTVAFKNGKEDKKIKLLDATDTVNYAPITNSLINLPEVNIFNTLEQAPFGNSMSLAVPLWEYNYTDKNNKGKIVHSMIYPWHRSTSLTNQLSLVGSEYWTSELKSKCWSNLRTAKKSLFLDVPYKLNPESIGIYRDDNQLITLNKSLYNGNSVGNHTYKGYENDLLLTGKYSLYEYFEENLNTNFRVATEYDTTSEAQVSDPVPMKYKSTTHLVFNLPYYDEIVGREGILPYVKDTIKEFGMRKAEETYPQWGKRKDVTATNTLYQNEIKTDFNIQENGIIYLAECFIDNPKIPDVKQEGFVWEVCSESMPLTKDVYEATIGDTYYQRYDCLKTYPNSFEDPNQIAEIFSFMCESKVNIDGRYDKRRGQPNNTLASPTNFNLLNKAYTQADNFFSYPYLKDPKFRLNKFPNQILWTKNKVYGESIDTWTHIVPTASIDADGTLGEITSLKLWNDNLICFQDKGFSQVMYNERAAISTEQGVPIELANSNTVDGVRYISNKVGCSNKYTIQVTQDGIYFIDSNNKEFYKWSQGLESISKNKGFNTYFYDLDINSIETFYDPKLKDVYLSLPKSDTERQCLVYSEQLGEFTSFFDYDLDYLLPFNDSLISIKDNTLWKQFSGDYLTYFGIKQPYSIDVISADKPLEDKIFTNIEFRSECFHGETNQEGLITNPTSSIIPTPLPFDSIKAWNTYQEGNSLFSKSMSKTSNISRKFRIWRADIPRVDNTVIERIRSPWARIKLTKDASNLKTVIHDLVVTYY